jgi:hypothetical protein
MSFVTIIVQGCVMSFVTIIVQGCVMSLSPSQFKVTLVIRILYIYFLFLVEGIMGRQKLELLEDRDKTLKGEVFYTCFLKWRRQQENGLAQICKLAELLRDVGMELTSPKMLMIAK